MSPIGIVGVVAMAALFMAKTGYELVLLVKKNTGSTKTTTGVYCNYPVNGACVWAGPDAAKVRTYELTDHLTRSIKPELEDQTRLLSEIRDSLRDHRR